VDLERDSSQLTQTHLDFMRRIEQENINRVLRMRAIRRRNLITGALLGFGVLSIYGYSIFAVKQESFLEE
jgi:hypothetical protein